MTKPQKKLGSQQTSLGSLSEASRLFDADQLKPIIQTHASKIAATNTDLRLGKLADKLTAVDGSIVNAMPSLIAASILKQTTETLSSNGDYTLTLKSTRLFRAESM